MRQSSVTHLARDIDCGSDHIPVVSKLYFTVGKGRGKRVRRRGGCTLRKWRPRDKRAFQSDARSALVVSA
eukprot:7230409-Alexandrium_andersonii.AAC.1